MFHTAAVCMAIIFVTRSYVGVGHADWADEGMQADSEWVIRQGISIVSVSDCLLSNTAEVLLTGFRRFPSWISKLKQTL